MYTEISFPSFGISINPSRIAFSIGAKPIYWYGIIIAVGFLLAVTYALRRSEKFGLTQDNIIDMLLCAVPCAIVCARLYYCLFSWEQYAENPIKLLYIWEGGLAIYGGVIGAVIGLIIITRIRHINTAAMLDIGGLGLLIGQSIGRWGNFFNREAFGAETDSFLRMGLMDSSGNITYYHPTFLYESLWNVAGFILLHCLTKKRKYDGQLFTAYLGWYGLGRFMIEGLRTDSLYIPSTNLRVSQLLAGICFITSCILLIYHAVFREHSTNDLFVNRLAKQREAQKVEENSDTIEPEVTPEHESTNTETTVDADTSDRPESD